MKADIYVSPARYESNSFGEIHRSLVEHLYDARKLERPTVLFEMVHETYLLDPKGPIQEALGALYRIGLDLGRLVVLPKK